MSEDRLRARCPLERPVHRCPRREYRQGGQCPWERKHIRVDHKTVDVTISVNKLDAYSDSCRHVLNPCWGRWKRCLRTAHQCVSHLSRLAVNLRWEGVTPNTTTPQHTTPITSPWSQVVKRKVRISCLPRNWSKPTLTVCADQPGVTQSEHPC